MGLIVFAMICRPFIDGWVRRLRPGSELSVYVGIVAALAIIGLTVWEALAEH